VSESTIGYATKIEPTEAELNLIVRLRQLRGMCIVDSDSMTIWPTLRAEFCNGRRSKLAKPDLPFVMDSAT
jgi:hypothetical protein